MLSTLLLIACSPQPALALVCPTTCPTGSAPALLVPAADLDELRRDIRDQYPDKRRRAVKGLVELGGEEALGLVLGALGDPDGQVADEAQLALPVFKAKNVLGRLLGKEGLRSKDDWVRVRAAEALGRWPSEVDPDGLIRALDRRDEPTSRMLLWSLERLGRRGLLQETGSEKTWTPVCKLVGRRVPDAVQAAALAALGASGAERALTLAKEAGVRSGHELRAAALEVLLELGDPSAEGSLVNALADELPSIRAHAARCAGRFPSKAGLVALVNRLESEPRPAIREIVASALATATGMKHGTHVRSWRHGIDSLPVDWTPAEAAEESRAELPAGQSVGAVGRFDLRSDRVAILVDFSGSLWNERKDGTRRKDALDPQVVALLESLPPEARFLLVPYTKENHPFHDEPLTASPRNVAKAQRWFERATMRGQGDLWGALELALANPEIDRIVAVTDGAPTGGRRWNIGLMGQLLAERTRFKPVSIDMILLDAPKGLVRRWAPAVDRLGGRLVAVDH